MKHKKITALLICTLMIITVFSITGCKDTEKEDTPIVHPIEITMNIDFPKVSGAEDINDEEFKVEEDSTALDALQIYCNVNELPITVETTTSSIDGINNVANGQYNDKKWQYKLNGEDCSVAPNEKKLKDGDVITWIYKK